MITWPISLDITETEINRFWYDDILRRYLMDYLKQGGSEEDLGRVLEMKFKGVVNNYAIYKFLGVNMSLSLAEQRTLREHIQPVDFGSNREEILELSSKLHRALMLPLPGRVGTILYFYDISTWRVKLENWYKVLPRGYGYRVVNYL